MAEMEINGLTYHVEMAGSGPPLLLLHGFTGGSQNWAEHMPVLGERQRLIAVDILGHGRSAIPSDPARYAMPRVAADLVAVLDALQIPQTNLLGYSMGGRLALYTAVRQPQRISHLILESASPGLAAAGERAARRRRDEELAGWIEAHGIEAFVDRWQALPLWASQEQLAPEKRAALRAQRLQNDPAGLANSLRGMGTGAQPNLWPHLSRLEKPALLLAGALDEKFVNINRRMAARLPSAQLQIVAGAGHTVHLERPSSFRRSILNFLAREEPGENL